MAFDIFRVDWILVDAIIISFLLLLLLSVRIFKYLNRWRTSLSNERLSRIIFEGSAIKAEYKNISIKKFELIKDSIEKNNKKLMIIIKTSKNRKLVNALAEAISTYGVDVIILNCKVLKKPRKENEKIESQKEIMKLIQSLFLFFSRNKIKINKNYFLVNFIPTNLMYKAFINDMNNDKLILINPKLNKLNKTLLINIFKSKDLRSRLFVIFSGKINRFLKKISLKQFIHDFKSFGEIASGFYLFKKASNTFKYYETILFRSIINVIENK
ncbi:MAG: hypothetical protein ACFE8E_14000 [Candidatus Hodarchaeota archaeon]